jgi:hypothetical protein
MFVNINKYKMNKIRTFLFVGLLCFSSFIFAEKSSNILTSKIKTSLGAIDEVFQASAIGSQYLNSTLTAEPAILDTEIKFINNIIKGLLPFSKGWAIGLNYGLTQFRGDIKESGFLESSSFSNSYSLEIEKQINPLLRISTEVVIGNLGGMRYNNSYTISKTLMQIDDPYENYEKIGERFENNFVEYDLKFCVDVESLIKKHYPRYKDKKKISIFYNFGIGINLFKSVKQNLDTDTYIYAYGYDDVNGNFLEMNNRRVRNRVLQYGASIRYSVMKNMDIKCSSIMRLSNSDYLDSSSMNSQPQNDRFRIISFGITYDFGKIDEIVD